jgi:hypothetical protein
MCGTPAYREGKYQARQVTLFESHTIFLTCCWFHWAVRATSACTPTAALKRTSRHFAFVPEAEVAVLHSPGRRRGKDHNVWPGNHDSAAGRA